MGKSNKPYARLLRASTTRVDGGCLFGATTKETWERFVSPDRQNRIAIGNYSMVINHPDGWVLVNAGPGDKAPLSLDVAPMRSRSSLLRELRELGLMPKDIATVVYTHLHAEHVGGGTHMTSSGRVLPTFPNARYLVQREALEEAMKPNERCRRLYRADDHEPLLESGQLEVVEGGSEICSGVWVEPAVGPTPGHQIVICQDGQRMYAFLGVLAPTSMHLWGHVNSAADWNPEATARTKVEVKRQAEMENWLVAPVGRDEWVPAAELDSLAAFSVGQDRVPDRKRTQRTAVRPEPVAIPA
jgi:glyoxylase-like metal-dependent hydrolase (beta-lactamase superfamily II)